MYLWLTSPSAGWFFSLLIHSAFHGSTSYTVFESKNTDMNGMSFFGHYPFFIQQTDVLSRSSCENASPEHYRKSPEAENSRKSPGQQTTGLPCTGPGRMQGDLFAQILPENANICYLPHAHLLLFVASFKIMVYILLAILPVPLYQKSFTYNL